MERELLEPSEIFSPLIGIVILFIFFMKLYQIVNLLRDQNEILSERLPKPEPKPYSAPGPTKSFEELFSPKKPE